MIDTTNLLWYSEISVEFLFCVYLVWTKVAKSYPVFTVFLGCSVVISLAATYFMRGAVRPHLPLSYTYFWLCTEPILLLLQVALALEVHTKMWKDYRAVLRRTCPLLIVALLIALVAAAIPLRSEAVHGGATQLIVVMHFGIQATRYISSVLAIFLVLSASLFLATVREVRANSVFQREGIMAAYFAVYAIAAFLIDTGWVRAIFVNGYFFSALTLCFVAWFSVFKPQPLPTE
jgi:hypothetical protein